MWLIVKEVGDFGGCKDAPLLLLVELNDDNDFRELYDAFRGGSGGPLLTLGIGGVSRLMSRAVGLDLGCVWLLARSRLFEAHSEFFVPFARVPQPFCSTV